MNILEIAILAEGSQASLAEKLGVTTQCVSMWRKRGLPHMVSRLLNSEYKKQLTKAMKAAQ
jgi:hypothetical protein